MRIIQEAARHQGKYNYKDAELLEKLPEKPDPKTDIKKILKTLSKMLIDTEDTIASQFEKLTSKIS